MPPLPLVNNNNSNNKTTVITTTLDDNNNITKFNNNNNTSNIEKKTKRKSSSSSQNNNNNSNNNRNVTSPLLVPPLNFAIVLPNILRSGYPNPRNYDFLKRLGIKTVILCSGESYEEYPLGIKNIAFFNANKIKMVHCKIIPHKEPFGFSNPQVVCEALKVILDTRNHPVLIHDEKGRHKCSVVIACLRKLQGWSLTSIFSEYELYSGNVRLLDLQWIEMFNEPIEVDRSHLPQWFMVQDGEMVITTTSATTTTSTSNSRDDESD
jgi:tyrosine-protein phosphatase SIW14